MTKSFKTAESPFKQDNTESGMAGVTLMNNQVGAVVAEVMGTKEGVTITPLPSMIRVDGIHRMDFVYDVTPAGDRGRTVQQWDRRLAETRAADRRWMIHADPLGYDQADPAFGPAAIISGHVRTWYAIGRKIARHWRHDDAVGEREVAYRQWLQQWREHRMPGRGHSPG